MPGKYLIPNTSFVELSPSNRLVALAKELSNPQTYDQNYFKLMDTFITCLHLASKAECAKLDKIIFQIRSIASYGDPPLTSMQWFLLSIGATFGIGTPKDLEHSFDCIRTSVAFNGDNPITLHGFALKYGENLENLVWQYYYRYRKPYPKSTVPRRVADHVKKAADLFYAPAMVDLGDSYLKRNLDEKKTAVTLYQQAIALGYIPAFDALSDFYKSEPTMLNDLITLHAIEALFLKEACNKLIVFANRNNYRGKYYSALYNNLTHLKSLFAEAPQEFLDVFLEDLWKTKDLAPFIQPSDNEEQFACYSQMKVEIYQKLQNLTYQKMLGIFQKDVLNEKVMTASQQKSIYHIRANLALLSLERNDKTTSEQLFLTSNGEENFSVGFQYFMQAYVDSANKANLHTAYQYLLMCVQIAFKPATQFLIRIALDNQTLNEENIENLYELPPDEFPPTFQALKNLHKTKILPLAKEDLPDQEPNILQLQQTLIAGKHKSDQAYEKLREMALNKDLNAKQMLIDAFCIRYTIKDQEIKQFLYKQNLDYPKSFIELNQSLVNLLKKFNFAFKFKVPINTYCFFSHEIFNAKTSSELKPPAQFKLN